MNRRPLKQLLKTYEWRGDLPDDLVVEGSLRLDSRRVQPGDAFIAQTADASLRSQYAADARDRGAVVVLSGTDLPQLDMPQVVVQNLDQRLYELSVAFYNIDWREIAQPGEKEG